MEQHIKLFANHSAYNAVKDQIDRPNVVMCQNEGDVHYNPPVETRVIAKFNVTNTNNYYKLVSYSGPGTDNIIGIADIQIDNNEKIDIKDQDEEGYEEGVNDIETFMEYQFDTLGEHIVKCTLIDPTTICDFYKTDIVEIIIPNSVTTIGDYGFSECSSLTSVTIPNSVTSIGECAFYHCSSMTSVTIGNSVESIGEQAFGGCDLTSITIPSSVASIGYYAFGCYNLTNVTCYPIIPPDITDDPFNSLDSCYIYVPSESLNDYLEDWGQFIDTEYYIIQAIPTT